MAQTDTSNVKQGVDNVSSYAVIYSAWWRFGEAPEEARPGLSLYVKIEEFEKRRLSAEEVVEVFGAQSLNVTGVTVRVSCRATISTVSTRHTCQIIIVMVVDSVGQCRSRVWPG